MRRRIDPTPMILDRQRDPRLHSIGLDVIEPYDPSPSARTATTCTWARRSRSTRTTCSMRASQQGSLPRAPGRRPRVQPEQLYLGVTSYTATHEHVPFLEESRARDAGCIHPRPPARRCRLLQPLGRSRSRSRTGPALRVHADRSAHLLSAQGAASCPVRTQAVGEVQRAQRRRSSR